MKNNPFLEIQENQNRGFVANICRKFWFGCGKYWKHVFSAFSGLGSALAYMPIINKEMKDAGFHDESTQIITSLNTLIGGTIFFTCRNYLILTDREHDNSSCLKKAIMCSSSAMAVATPLYMLWSIEISDEQHEHEKGLNEFTIYAIATTAPLFVTCFLSAYNARKSFLNSDSIELTSIGSKLTVYSLSAVSTISNIVLSAKVLNDVIFRADDIKDNPIPIFAFAVCLNISPNIIDFHNLKKAFKHNANEAIYKITDYAKFGILILESLIVTLPESIVSYKAYRELDCSEAVATALTVPHFLLRMNANILDINRIVRIDATEKKALEEKEEFLDQMKQTIKETLREELNASSRVFSFTRNDELLEEKIEQFREPEIEENF